MFCDVIKHMSAGHVQLQAIRGLGLLASLLTPHFLYCRPRLFTWGGRGFTQGMKGGIWTYQEAEYVGVLLDGLGGGLPGPVPRLNVHPHEQGVLLTLHLKMTNTLYWRWQIQNTVDDEYNILKMTNTMCCRWQIQYTIDDKYKIL